MGRFVILILDETNDRFVSKFTGMATFNDPGQCFAPLEVIERMLEIREELGFSQTLYIPQTDQLTDFLDSYGFDIYAFSTKNEDIDFGHYRSPVVPGGDVHHLSVVGH